MGLGKTIEILALVCANPLQAQLVAHQPTYCDDFPRFRTKATLVICPNHLVKQWMDEIKSKTNLKVESIISITQHKKLTYHTIVNTDIILISANFLASKSYFQVCCFDNSQKYWSSSHIVDSATIGKELLRRKDPLTSFTPIFHLFDWHRVVIYGSLSTFPSYFLLSLPFPSLLSFSVSLSFFPSPFFSLPFLRSLSFLLSLPFLFSSLPSLPFFSPFRFPFPYYFLFFPLFALLPFLACIPLLP